MEKKIRILHIDDSMHDRLLVKDALLREDDKFEIIEADNREVFEHYLKNEEFDLVLSDFNILGFDGLQVIQFVKEFQPGVPVIIVTGTGSEEIAIQAMKMGASDYVIKSVSHIQGLPHAINNIMELKKLNDERIKAEKALKESEQLFHNLSHISPVGIFRANTEGNLTYVNPMCLNMTRLNPEDISSGNFLNRIHHDDRKRIVDLWYNSITAQEPFMAEWRFLKPESSVLWVLGNAVPEVNGNVYTGYIGTLTDITDRKSAEEEIILAKEKAEECDRLKTAFLHNISHEIRTPMNAIIGFSELLESHDLTPDKRMEYSTMIIKSSNHLLGIINDIISISTIEAGQVKTNKQPLVVKDLCSVMYNKYSAKAKLQNLTFSYVTSNTPDDFSIVTDESMLTQIIDNLVNNALKFTRKGSVVLGYEKIGEFVQFFVADTGIGIPKTLHEEIFKRFRQVDTGYTRQYGGSGLGLSISKAYVELLGGSMRLESEMGKGSTFYFTLPASNK